MKVLLLGGTGEARELAQLLVSAGSDVVSSLAGRTTDARLPAGEVRSGGFVRELIEDAEAGYPRLKASRAAAASHPIEEVRRKLLSLKE